jgi:hypothetical protein
LLLNCHASILAQNSPPGNLILPADNQSQRFGVQLMFLFEYSRCKSFLSVVIKHRDNALRDDWATVESLINKVNGTTGPLDAVLQYLSMSVKSGKRRQQTRMNIQNAITIGFDEEAREQSHITRKTNYLYSLSLKRRDNIAIMFISTSAVTLDDGCLEAPPFCHVHSRSVWLIANHHGNYSPRDATFIYGAREREHV